jgi:hypothetical protein
MTLISPGPTAVRLEPNTCLVVISIPVRIEGRTAQAYVHWHVPVGFEQ